MGYRPHTVQGMLTSMPSEVETAPTVAEGASLRIRSNIRVLRGDLPLAAAARIVGIDRNELRRIEKGETGQIRFDTLVKLCEAYHCTIGDLLEVERTEPAGDEPVYAGALAALSKGLIAPAPRRAVRRDMTPDVADPDRAGGLVTEVSSRRRSRGVPTLNR